MPSSASPPEWAPHQANVPGPFNGRQIADEARKLRRDLKVLFTTGYAQNAIIHQGRLDPGVQLIVKPFNFAGLVAKTRQMFDEADDPWYRCALGYHHFIGTFLKLPITVRESRAESFEPSSIPPSQFAAGRKGGAANRATWHCRLTAPEVQVTIKLADPGRCRPSCV
jgi:hypothetical protein